MIFGGAAFSLYLDSILFANVKTGFVFHSVSIFIGLLMLVLVIKISKNTGKTLAKYGRKGNLKRMETNVLVNQGLINICGTPCILAYLFSL